MEARRGGGTGHWDPQSWEVLSARSPLGPSGKDARSSYCRGGSQVQRGGENRAQVDLQVEQMGLNEPAHGTRERGSECAGGWVGEAGLSRVYRHTQN